MSKSYFSTLEEPIKKRWELFRLTKKDIHRNNLVTHYSYIPEIESERLSKKYHSTKEDLYQEGILGLFRAIEIYDFQNNFDIYAKTRVKGKIIDYLRKSTILSRNQQEIKRVAITRKDTHFKETGERLDLDELIFEVADEIGKNKNNNYRKDTIQRIISLNSFVLSTNVKISTVYDKLISIEERLESKNNLTGFGIISELKENLQLTRRDKLILFLFLEGLSTKEIGKVVDLHSLKVLQEKKRLLNLMSKKYV